MRDSDQYSNEVVLRDLIHYNVEEDLEHRDEVQKIINSALEPLIHEFMNEMDQSEKYDFLSVAEASNDKNTRAARDQMLDLMEDNEKCDLLMDIKDSEDDYLNSISSDLIRMMDEEQVYNLYIQSRGTQNSERDDDLAGVVNPVLKENYHEHRYGGNPYFESATVSEMGRKYR